MAGPGRPLLERSKGWGDSKGLRRVGQGGPNANVVRGHRVGKKLLDLVARMMAGGAITTSKAGKVLGVRAKQVQAILDTAGRHGTPTMA